MPTSNKWLVDGPYNPSHYRRCNLSGNTHRDVSQPLLHASLFWRHDIRKLGLHLQEDSSVHGSDAH